MSLRVLSEYNSFPAGDTYPCVSHLQVDRPQYFSDTPKLNGNDAMRCRNNLGHVAPLGLTGEHYYISHQATRFGKDSNPPPPTPKQAILLLTCHWTHPCPAVPWVRQRESTKLPTNLPIVVVVAAAAAARGAVAYNALLWMWITLST